MTSERFDMNTGHISLLVCYFNLRSIMRICLPSLNTYCKDMSQSILSYTALFLICSLICACSKKPGELAINGGKEANQLIDESSPYLLQHAYNPVEWYPWGDKALDKAKNENKLMIVSIGYAACHWCHVMEHESFEDSLVASIMNENFVSVKVDREERPDVDDVYMTAAQLISGRGGWPLNAITLPDGKPIFAGTYFPKEQWIGILKQFVQLQKDDPERLKTSAEELTNGIAESNLIKVQTNPFSFDMEQLSSVVNISLSNYDMKKGGRKGSPKFPMPNAYEFLLKYNWLTQDKLSLDATLVGLNNMADGGIYDHLGGGFARYSTDDKWLAPHFEKMLYDNGQLVSVYAQAYQLTKDNKFKSVIEETIEFVERELKDDKGGFYSSLDADSEGEEGKFYVWSEEEIDEILGESPQVDIFKKYYDVSNRGNWEHKVILRKVDDIEQLSRDKGLDPETTWAELKVMRDRLLSARAKRVRPGTDDKILTSWNALMIMGYIDAYNALGTASYLESAKNSTTFLLKNQKQKDGRLLRNHKNGKSSINAFLDDYALTINALLKLYQVTFDEKWIAEANELATYAIEHFYNNETKMFDYTSKLDPPLVAKKAEYNDNVIPASNSAMARGLFTLGTLTYNKSHLDMSKQMLNNMMPQLEQMEHLSFYSNWLQLLLDHLMAPFEIAIVGQDAVERRQELASKYLGNSIFLGGEEEGSLALLESKLIPEATMIYVCQNKVCKFPVETVTEALPLIKH